MSHDKIISDLRCSRSYQKMLEREVNWPRIEGVYLDRALHIWSKVVHSTHGPGRITSFSKGGKIYIYVIGRDVELVEGSDLRWFQA